jgi:hypothetical protein
MWAAQSPDIARVQDWTERLTDLEPLVGSVRPDDLNYQLYPGFPEAGRMMAVNLRYRY